MRQLTVCLLLQLLHLTAVSAGNWTKPNGLAPSFTDTYTVNERIFVSWINLNNSLNDLWLTRYDTRIDDFALRLQVARNISYADSFEWTIAVDANEVAKDTRFILQFLPTGSTYNPNQTPQLPSPAFNLITLNQQTLPNGTIGAPSVTPSATEAASTQTTTPSNTTSSSAATDSPPPGGPGLNRSVAIGVAVGAAIIAIGSVVGAYFVIRVYRHPKPKVQSTIIAEEEFKAFGPYEVLGMSRQPTELSSKETTVYEMTDSKETLVYENDSSKVYEISTTTKKPGVHELPG